MRGMAGELEGEEVTPKDEATRPESPERTGASGRSELATGHGRSKIFIKNSPTGQTDLEETKHPKDPGGAHKTQNSKPFGACLLKVQSLRRHAKCR